MILANRLQGLAIRRHRAAGGRLVHDGWAFLVGLGFMAGFLGLAVGGALLLEEDRPGTSLDLYEADTIHYSGDATERDARRLAELLKAEDVLGAPEGIGVRLEIDGKKLFVGLFYEAGDEDDPDLRTYLIWLGERIATLFPGRSVFMRVYDQDGELRRTFSSN